MTANITIDPATGLPHAFEAAARLGEASRDFMLLITNRGARKGYVQLWLCLLSRTRGRKSGRGSQGKRRWREWWTPIHCIGEALAWEDAETVHHDMMGRMRSLNVRTQWESKLPDNVHILWDDAVDAAAQTA